MQHLVKQILITVIGATGPAINCRPLIYDCSYQNQSSMEASNKTRFTKLNELTDKYTNKADKVNPGYLDITISQC